MHLSTLLSGPSLEAWKNGICQEAEVYAFYVDQEDIRDIESMLTLHASSVQYYTVDF